MTLPQERERAEHEAFTELAALLSGHLVGLAEDEQLGRVDVDVRVGDDEPRGPRKVLDRHLVAVFVRILGVLHQFADPGIDAPGSAIILVDREGYFRHGGFFRS